MLDNMLPHSMSTVLPMAIQVPPLTATRIQQAKPAEKEYNLSDGGSLQLRVKPTGTWVVWLLNYRKPFTGSL